MDSIREIDPTTADLIEAEAQRQRQTLRLIPSENYASAAVLAASGTSLANKYSEGYPRKRYYQGQAIIDQLEQLAIDRVKALFGAEHANVQPYSGSPANLAVYNGLLKPGDRILSMSLPHGGHLTHGWKVTLTGKHYDVTHYGVRKEDQLIDIDAVAKLAKEVKPKLIICGASAYPRIIDFAAFAQIAQDNDALLLADIAHIAGLVVGGVHPSPIPYADVVTSTTHKTLRGPRSGLIMCKTKHKKAIDRGVFPGLQGGPHNHTTAALCVALAEAATPEFTVYAQQVVDNAQTLAARLLHHGFDLVSGGTDNHLMLIDMSSKGVSGRQAAVALERAGIVCNANSIPFDPRTPFDPSGIRIGTPALTSRGMGAAEMTQLADWMSEVIGGIDDEIRQVGIAKDVQTLCTGFAAPGL